MIRILIISASEVMADYFLEALSSEELRTRSVYSVEEALETLRKDGDEISLVLVTSTVASDPKLAELRPAYDGLILFFGFSPELIKRYEFDGSASEEEMMSDLVLQTIGLIKTGQEVSQDGERGLRQFYKHFGENGCSRWETLLRLEECSLPEERRQQLRR